MDPPDCGAMHASSHDDLDKTALPSSPDHDRRAATLVLVIGLGLGLGLVSLGFAIVATEPLTAWFHECAEGLDYFLESAGHGSILTGP